MEGGEELETCVEGESGVCGGKVGCIEYGLCLEGCAEGSAVC